MELTSKIMKLNEELVSKTSQIDILIQEKMELEKTTKQKRGGRIFNRLNFGINDKGRFQNGENHNDIINNNHNSEDKIYPMSNNEIKKLNEEISQLKADNEMCVKKMTSALEKAENKKLEFKNEIKGYNDKIKLLEDEIKMLQDEKSECQDRIKLTA